MGPENLCKAGEKVKTTSINVMNLCVPCENRCRYCLLSYDGKVSGLDYARSEAYARRFYTWLRENRPELSFLFGFGYSMEHPRLLDAIDFCRSIGSATGEFLQFDGMKFRTKPELTALLTQLKAHGIRLIDLTFYGTESYHDRFAARSGDYRLMMDTLEAANQVGLDASISIPITHENAGQIDALLAAFRPYRTQRIICFVPHSEGRGRSLNAVCFSAEDYKNLSDEVRAHLNTNRFRTESQWLQDGFPVNENRVLTLTLTPENIDYFENLPFADTIAYLEKLDDDYYSAIPPVEILAAQYGDPGGDLYYSARDLYLNYQQRYIEAHKIEVYDINDERQCFSRRY